MTSVSLSFYKMVIYQKRYPKKHEWIGQVGSTGYDAISMLHQFFQKLPPYDPTTAGASGIGRQFDENTVFVEKNSVTSVSGGFKGYLRSGSGGFQSDLLDKRSGKVTHQRQVTDIEVLPFLFLFLGTQMDKSGILMLQRFGQHGVASSVLAEAVKHLSSQMPGYMVKFWPISVSNVVLSRFNASGGEIKQLEATMIRKTGDRADKSSVRVKTLVSVGPVTRGKSILNKLASKVLGARTLKEAGEALSELIATDIDPADISKVKAEVKIGNSTRHLTLGSGSGLVSNFDVSEDVPLAEATGLPVRPNLEAIATAISVNDIKPMV